MLLNTVVHAKVWVQTECRLQTAAMNLPFPLPLWLWGYRTSTVQQYHTGTLLTLWYQSALGTVQVVYPNETTDTTVLQTLQSALCTQHPPPFTPAQRVENTAELMDPACSRPAAWTGAAKLAQTVPSLLVSAWVRESVIFHICAANCCLKMKLNSQGSYKKQHNQITSKNLIHTKAQHLDFIDWINV